jgi:hypothetical protein
MRHHPDAPETAEARIALKARTAEMYIQRLLNEEPRLPYEMRDYLAALLCDTGGGVE